METHINEIEYKDGFNRGFWLFNYEPEVAKLLVKPESDINDDFSIGFAEGMKQAELEKTLNEFENLRDSNEQHDIDINI